MVSSLLFWQLVEVGTEVYLEIIQGGKSHKNRGTGHREGRIREVVMSVMTQSGTAGSRGFEKLGSWRRGEYPPLRIDN
jgi:hypothetical protein